MDIYSEELAYWYFRLNGFFGNQNFLIHKKLHHRGNATEVDYLGVRFMHRKELSEPGSSEYFEDDNESKLFKYYNKQKIKGNIYVCIGEVKKGQPEINGPLLKDNSLKQLLLSLGCVHKKAIPKVIKKLLTNGFCCINRYYITFVLIGEYDNSDVIPYKIPVITWNEIKSFIYKRFKEGKTEKSDIYYWAELPSINDLVSKIKTFNKVEDFIKETNVIHH